MLLTMHSSSARVVATPLAHADLMRSGQPSLFAAMRMSSEHSHLFKEMAVGTHGFVNEVGFAAGWAAPLSQLPRNMAFYQEFMRDRFFWVTTADCGGHLGRLEINEALVEDTYMRGAIDYTGFQLILTLSKDAYSIFANRVEIGKPRPDYDDRNVILGIPTPPFAFPAQRGNPKPGDARIKCAADLQPIKRLELDDMIVALVNRRAGEPPDGASMHDRFELISAARLTLATEGA
ncbi:hypothetical protein JQ594_01850 [Bradyrhizobium manausense]|uniref:hypothetical protein n=1 Tax=Bradyrhizobium manausense TaxID=989370 RepID=UPI001BAA9209|nr:hypothetical protein [Bradyrhizobium manausense]MBR0684645.1 hypothetical protein [Bradyrhizobium manausense]